MIVQNIIAVLPASPDGKQSEPQGSTERHRSVLCHAAMRWLLLILAARAELEYELLRLHESHHGNMAYDHNLCI